MPSLYIDNEILIYDGLVFNDMRRRCGPLLSPFPRLPSFWNRPIPPLAGEYVNHCMCKCERVLRVKTKCERLPRGENGEQSCAVEPY